MADGVAKLLMRILLECQSEWNCDKGCTRLCKVAI